jgi:hypothetical protein
MRWGDILHCSLLYLWTLLLSRTHLYGRGLWLAVVSFVEHQILVLQEVLYCKLAGGSEDNTVRNNTDFDCLVSRRDLEGSVESKCKHWRHKWIRRWILRDCRPSHRLCWLLKFLALSFGLQFHTLRRIRGEFETSITAHLKRHVQNL